MAAFKGDSIFWVEVEKVVPNPYQPRREFDENKLKELAESIRMYGVLQPLTVSRVEVPLDNGAFRSEYELIAGERRLRASKLAGLAQVPVIIREGDDSEQEKLELAIIENLQREDLNAVDRALAFRQLSDVFGLSHAQVAKKVGRSREYVSNTIRLLGLPDYMLQALREKEISEGHARTLLMLNDRPEEQDTVYREILLKKLSVREVERISRKIATDKVRNQKWQDSDPQLIEKEKEFTETLGTRVQIAKTDYGGKVTIDYFSDEDLENLLMLLKRDKSTLSVSASAAVMSELDEVMDSSDAAMASLKNATPLSAHEEEEVIEPFVSSTDQSEPDEDRIDVSVSPASREAKMVDTIVSENTLTVSEAPAAVAAHTESNEDINDLVSETIDEEPKITEEEIEPVRVEESVLNDGKPISPLREKLMRLFGESKTVAPDAETTIETVTEEPAAPTVLKEEEPTTPATEVPKKSSDDDDLYNLKNFSI